MRYAPQAPKSRRRWPLMLGWLVVIAVLLWLVTSRVPAGIMHFKKSPTLHFNTHQYSLDDPSSLWVIVNKQRPLMPKDFVPATVVPYMPLRLEPEDEEMHVNTLITPDLEAMVAAAKQAGVNLKLASGYRSYTRQVDVYDNEVRDYGQSAADSESARPGTSEHQTGLAVDLEPVSRDCELQDCFAGTPEGKWLAANAYKFGFIQRYVPGKEQITGYRAESWHFRYVGTALSKQMHQAGTKTLEEFFNLRTAKDY